MDELHKLSCSRKVITVHQDAKVNEAVELLKKNNISVLPVKDDKGIVGIVSEEDLLKETADSPDFLFE